MSVSTPPRRLRLDERRRLVRVVDDALSALDDGNLEESEALFREAMALQPEDPRVFWLGGELALAQADPKRARNLLEQALHRAPDFADAHDAMARACEALGDEKARIGHSLRVLALDARADRHRIRDRSALLDWISAEVQSVLDGLPSDLARRVGPVPVILEPRPSFELVRSGFDPRALGLFEGREHGDTETSGTTTRIVLFYANLLAIAEDEAMLAEQIEVTILHEIGHFFGLDEADVERLGLA